MNGSMVLVAVNFGNIAQKKCDYSRLQLDCAAEYPKAMWAENICCTFTVVKCA